MTSPFSSLFAKQMNNMLQYKKALGYSRSSYYKFLLNFDKFCIQYFPEESVLTQKLVMNWGRKRKDENINGLKRRLIAIREFGKYLNSIDIIAYIIPSAMIGSFKPFTPYIFADLELKAFFKAADNIPAHKLSPLREFTAPVLFRLLYCCGLRPNEIRNIKCYNINLNTGTLYISETKMHKDRTVIISKDVLALCNKYDTQVKIIYMDREYFFQSLNGKPYTANWIQNIFWKCWKVAGIDNFHGSRPRVSDFRHNYATRTLQKWLDEDKDLYVYLPYLSAYMGHSNFSETAYYIHLLPERLVNSSGIKWNKFERIIPEVKL
jgi:integrase